jgi:mannose-6-phosphate isomerase-like protein (cupin superfamily)
MTHEDERRILEDFAEGKILTLKKDSSVGRHFHKIKTEIFYLIKGGGFVILDGVKKDIIINDPITILPFTKHEFHLRDGSVLLGFCSHEYNSEDDIRY